MKARKGGGYLQNLPEGAPALPVLNKRGHGNTLKNCEACGRLVPCSAEAIGVTCGRCIQISARGAGEQALSEEQRQAANVLAYRKRRAEVKEERRRKRGQP